MVIFSHVRACEAVAADVRSCGVCERACKAIVCDDEQNRKIYKLNRYDCMELVAVYYIHIREISCVIRIISPLY